MTGRLPEDHPSFEKQITREFTDEELSRIIFTIGITLSYNIGGLVKEKDNAKSKKEAQEIGDATNFANTITEYLENPPDGTVTLQKLGELVEEAINKTNNDAIANIAEKVFIIAVVALFPGEDNLHTVIMQRLRERFFGGLDEGRGGPGGMPGSN